MTRGHESDVIPRFTTPAPSERASEHVAVGSPRLIAVSMVRLVSAPVRVVDTDQVKISEYFGGASCNPCPYPVGDISVAHVQAEAGWAEEWQTPAFDEYALVLRGSVTIETTRGPATKVSAGQAVFLAKGERVRWHFTESAEYVPICLPAFSPDNCFREDSEAAKPPPSHDSHDSIYHLVQKPLWEASKARPTTHRHTPNPNPNPNTSTSTNPNPNPNPKARGMTYSSATRLHTPNPNTLTLTPSPSPSNPKARGTTYYPPT